jgi:hypothetical protein
MKLCVELRENAKPAIFEGEKEPGKETHPQYDIIFGPLKSQKTQKNT